MNVYVVCNVHIRMSQQSGEDLYIRPFVIAIRRKSVSEHILSPVRNTRSPAQALRLISQGFIGKLPPIVIHENPFNFARRTPNTRCSTGDLHGFFVQIVLREPSPLSLAGQARFHHPTSREAFWTAAQYSASTSSPWGYRPQLRPYSARPPLPFTRSVRVSLPSR